MEYSGCEHQLPARTLYILWNILDCETCRDPLYSKRIARISYPGEAVTLNACVVEIDAVPRAEEQAMEEGERGQEGEGGGEEEEGEVEEDCEEEP